MSDIKKIYLRGAATRHKQRGLAAVEFSVLVLIFLTFFFGIFEVARAMYLINTLQEVTRRAAAMAANSNFDSSTIDTVRSQAMFADSSGHLVLGDPITSANLRIEYLAVSKDSATGSLQLTPATMPSCPARNKLNCMADPYSSSCIRFVRARICDAGSSSTCDAVQYKMLFPLIDLSALRLPISTTVAPAQGFGYTVGSMPCP